MAVSSLLLAAMTGYCIGRTAAVQFALPPAAPRLLRDERPSVPTVVLERIRDEQLQGQVTAGVRLFIGDAQLPTSASGAFRMAAGTLAMPEKSVHVPEGMHFVASRKGKKFYPVLGAAAAKIAVQNRVYFPSKEAAVQAGYKP